MYFYFVRANFFSNRFCPPMLACIVVLEKQSSCTFKGTFMRLIDLYTILTKTESMLLGGFFFGTYIIYIYILFKSLTGKRESLGL